MRANFLYAVLPRNHHADLEKGTSRHDRRVGSPQSIQPSVFLLRILTVKREHFLPAGTATLAHWELDIKL